MELIKSEQPNTPVEPEPRYRTASSPTEETENGQTWLRTLAVILVGLVLIVLIVFLARWIYHKTHHAVTPAPATNQHAGTKSSPKNASGAQSANNPGSAPSQPAGNSSNSTGTNPQITNTGPGDVAAIFVGTSLAAAGLHYIISIRRFSKNRV